MVWSPDIEEGSESKKIKYEIVQYTRGKVLDLGCGPWKTYPHFIGVDTHEEWVGDPWDSDITADCTKLHLFASNSMEAVFSSHLLEHVKHPLKVLKEWWRVVKLEGYLILYLPHKDFYPKRGEIGYNLDHEQDFLPNDIIEYMEEVGTGWDLVRNEERNEDDEYSFFQVYRKKPGKKQTQSYKDEKPEKTCGIVRYGGFGDMVQMSSVLPELKKQGYHITVYITPKGYDVVKDDPSIDEFFIQDNEQVPNQELTPFWKVQASKHDKWINLSESVEGTWLAIPGRTQHLWTNKVRQKVMDFNYIEFTHLMADVPFKPATKFFPTEKEKKWARKFRSKYNGPVLMWTLSGSSVHKTWPYLDQAIARLMTESAFHILLVGDHLCEILEYGWEKEPRVIPLSGKLSIRQTLTLAEECDLVIGPETGVMNSISMNSVPKMIFLSHSSVNNLTRDWVNCASLMPENCECYPCHKLIYGFQHCSRDEETGVSECQAKISMEQFWSAYQSINRELKKVA